MSFESVPERCIRTYVRAAGTAETEGAYIDPKSALMLYSLLRNSRSGEKRMRNMLAASLLLGGIAFGGVAQANSIVTESFTGTITSAGSHNGNDVAGYFGAVKFQPRRRHGDVFVYVRRD